MRFVNYGNSLLLFKRMIIAMENLSDLIVFYNIMIENGFPTFIVMLMSRTVIIALVTYVI